MMKGNRVQYLVMGWSWASRVRAGNASRQAPIVRPACGWRSTAPISLASMSLVKGERGLEASYW